MVFGEVTRFQAIRYYLSSTVVASIDKIVYISHRAQSMVPNTTSDPAP